MNTTTNHTNATDCPACHSGLGLTDLPVGTRVRVPHRKGAIGTVTQLHPWDGADATNFGLRRDLVAIKFDQSGTGWNAPAQCEVI